MARTNIQVVITVKDGATQPLEKVQKGIKNTGKAAKDSTADIWQFTKTMFSAGAFIGLFARSFRGLTSAMEVGAPLSKMTQQFERVMGPRGDLLNTIDKATNTVVDEFTAMEAGLKLGQMGITSNANQAGGLIAQMAVAARMAGKEGSEGVKDLTGALVDGNFAMLEQYGLINKNNPALMAQIAILNKMGGTLGSVASKQMQLALVQKILTDKTKDFMFMMLSTGDLIQFAGTRFGELRQHIGLLIGTAFRPLLEKLIPLMFKLKEMVFDIYTNNKHIVFLTKTVLALSAALGGLFATLGSLKLIIKLLGFTPFGFGGMALAITAVAAAFVGLTRAADGPLEKLKIFGAFFEGIYDLVTNFDPETGMSKISASTKKLLGDSGIYGIVKYISAVVVTVKTTLKDIWDLIKFVAGGVDSFIKDTFGGIEDNMKGAIDWTTAWTSDSVSNIDKVTRAAKVLGRTIAWALAGWGLLKLGGGLLSKIPVIGGLFGGRGSKNHGESPNNPTYTKEVGGLGGGAGGIGTALAAGGIWTALKGSMGLIFQSIKLDGWVAMIKNLPTILSLAFETAFPRLFAAFAGWGPFIGKAIGLAAAFTAGYAVGNEIMNFQDKWQANSRKSSDEYSRELAKKYGFTEMYKPTKEENEEQKRKEYELAKKQGYDHGMTFEEYSAKQPKSSTGKQTSVSVPTTNANDEALVQTIGEQMKSMNKADSDAMAAAYTKAIDASSQGGALITPEEFGNFQTIMTRAFDGSKNLQELVNINKEKKTTMRANQRGS